MIINQKYLIKEILNKYLSFYKCFGDNENGILFLNYSINKLNSVCKEWKNEFVPNLIFPRINITNKDDLAYVVEWIERYDIPIYDIYFPFHHQQTIFKDNFQLPQLTESIPIIANRITSISFRSGKIDYGGTILLTENTKSASFGVFNNKEYQKFCNVLSNYCQLIKDGLKKLTLTTILYECDIDVLDFKDSIRSLLTLDSLTLASCFQNQIQSLDLIPQLSTSLRKIKLLYINIEYEMLLNMITIIVEKQQQQQQQQQNGSASGEGSNLCYFELNAKFLNKNHIIKSKNSRNGKTISIQKYDNGVLWEDPEDEIDNMNEEAAVADSDSNSNNTNLIKIMENNNSNHWYYLDGLFELISNWKSLKSFKLTMPDETVNVSSVLNFLGCQENLKTFTFIVKLNDDINVNNSSSNSGGGGGGDEYITSINNINKSVEKMMIKSFIENDKYCIPMIWNHCESLNRLELHLDGDTMISSDDGEFYKFKNKQDDDDLQVSLVSINHPFSNKLFKSIENNLNIVSVVIINEISEFDSIREILISNHPKIRYLNFNKSDCKNPCALSLIDPISNNNVIEFLYISGILSNEESNYQFNNLKLLISILENNNTLIHLDFSFNLLPTTLSDDDPLLIQLINALHSNNTIQSLTINGCWEPNTNIYKIIQKTLLQTGKLISYSDNAY